MKVGNTAVVPSGESVKFDDEAKFCTPRRLQIWAAGLFFYIVFVATPRALAAPCEAEWRGTPWHGKVTVDGDTLYMHDFTWCFCLKASPCPCTSCCCCDGPHVQMATFVKESDTKYVADGNTSVWKGGCCAGMCNNKGDAVELKDGKLWWHAGDNNVVPPCLKGMSDVAYMSPAGGAPANATMER